MSSVQVAAQKEIKRFHGVVEHYIKNNQLIIFTVSPEKGI